VKTERNIKVKKVSFRVRKIYYDQFANGTKDEELRALIQYWFRILRPPLPFHLKDTKIEEVKKILLDFGVMNMPPANQPKIAVISCPRQPTLSFKIDSIWIDKPEAILGRELSEQGRRDIPTELCIVTRMGKQIK